MDFFCSFGKVCESYGVRIQVYEVSQYISVTKKKLSCKFQPTQAVFTNDC